ncbi:terminase small subunit [Lapidilactobacillus bayanensis]|uniref:terminase small subunit n=1 Tax=Lapidilactobacillus bayanensis TaxID=2485998 RepID=UPI000F7A681D|nr:terminase small subunit [Lapidilactobacillus bayanensis]
MSHKLTSKQQKFADEYIESGNAFQSAINAGYSKNYSKAQSSKLLENVGIKSYIDERMQELESQKIMGAKEAIELLTSIARGEIKETVVVSTPIGAEEVQKEADFKTRISAIREILKRYPDSDKLTEAQVRKASAEAEIVEYKAEVLRGGNSTDINITIGGDADGD